MYKIMVKKRGLVDSALVFGLRMAWEHVGFIAKSFLAICAMAACASLLPLFIMVWSAREWYGVDLIDVTRMYLNNCIPAGDCSWADFLVLVDFYAPSLSEQSLLLRGILITLMILVFYSWIMVGAIRVALAWYDKKRTYVAMFYQTPCALILRMLIVGMIWGQFLGVMLIFSQPATLANFIVILLLFCIFIRFLLTPWFIVHKEDTVFEALRQSFRATRGYAVRLMVVWVLYITCSKIVGLIWARYLVVQWLITIFVTVPVILGALTYFYRQVARR